MMKNDFDRFGDDFLRYSTKKQGEGFSVQDCYDAEDVIISQIPNNYVTKKYRTDKTALTVRPKDWYPEMPIIDFGRQFNKQINQYIYYLYTIHESWTGSDLDEFMQDWEECFEHFLNKLNKWEKSNYDN